jgi:hypothetical protein
MKLAGFSSDPLLMKLASMDLLLMKLAGVAAYEARWIFQ